jgi:hypothetical protein
MIKNFKWLLLVAATFIACNNSDEETLVYDTSDGLLPTAGSANFAKFVSLGNSLTAGYSDNALFIDGQKMSYANIMAQQFATVGGGEFKIPFMADNIGGFKINGVLFAGSRLASTGGTAPVPVPGTPSTEITTSIATAGPYNNCGVPGAKSFHLLSPSYGSLAGISLGTANPYYARFAPNATTSVLAYAVSQKPTFFSLWIGNNDVLGYGTSGGDGTNPITPSAGVAGVGFDATYDVLVNTLISTGAKGVVATIPYVNTVPFFTTVGNTPVPLVEAQVTALNAAYAGYNGGLVAAKNLGLITEAERLQRTINFVVGNNAPVMVDEYLTDITAVNPALIKIRQTSSADYILLSSNGASIQTHLGAGNGTQFPLQDSWVLSKNEVAEVKTATDSYNAKIKSIAIAKGLAFVDTNALMTQIANGGVSSNGFTVTGAFITGGGFSTDGVHPSPRGYALIANKFIEAINATYGSNLKGVDLGNYRILFPNVL